MPSWAAAASTPASSVRVWPAARETTRYNLSASRFDTDGIDVLTDIGDDDRDGYDNTVGVRNAVASAE
jgi:outer membrane cobalamin receptor